MLLIWHYTARLTTHLGNILRTGGLRLNEIEPPLVRLGFPACVWFSTNQHYEAVASKLPWIGGTPSADGITIAARIGIAPEAAPLTWSSWRQAAMGRALFRRQRERIAEAFTYLTAIAGRAGADVSQWRASLDVVPCAGWQAVEVFVEGEWVPYDPSDPAHALRNTIPLPDGSEAELVTVRATDAELAARPTIGQYWTSKLRAN
jgi:hypothetical protein